MLATRADDDVRLAALDFREWTQTFPSPVRALGRLPARSLAIDGVVCVMDARGADVRRAARRGRRRARRSRRPCWIAWDLLWLDDEDLRPLPLAERRAASRGARRCAGSGRRVVAVAGRLARRRRRRRSQRLGIRGGRDAWLDGAYESPWHAPASASATDRLAA
jgi:hypothetical protein